MADTETPPFFDWKCTGCGLDYPGVPEKRRATFACLNCKTRVVPDANAAEPEAEFVPFGKTKPVTETIAEPVPAKAGKAVVKSVSETASGDSQAG